MSSSIFDKTTNALGASINFRQLKEQVASSNIANAETPGYKAKKVDFEAALARAVDIEGMYKTDANSPDEVSNNGGDFKRLAADVYENPDITVTNDGNTVDLEREMAELSENTIIYRAAVQLINKKLAGLAYASTEGGLR